MKKDSLSVIKLLIFLAIFLVVLSLFLILFIIPAMKQYKTNEVVLKRYESILDKKNSEIELLKAKKEKLEKKYKNYIKKYTNRFDEKKFVDFLNNYASDVKILEKKKLDNKTIYKVKMTLKEMKSFYKVIEDVKNLDNIVNISFPIVIKKEDKSYNIIQNVTVLHSKLKKTL